jgi:glutamyl-tRNA synthetase
MDLFNFKVEKVEKTVVQATFLGESYEEARKLGAPLIHWIPVDSGITCEVTLPDASVAKGVAEDSCRSLEPNEIIQFQRFGFVRVDSMNEKLSAYFAHR